MKNPMKNGFEVGRFKPVTLLNSATQIIATCARLLCTAGALPLATVATLAQPVLMRFGGIAQ